MFEKYFSENFSCMGIPVPTVDITDIIIYKKQEEERRRRSEYGVPNELPLHDDWSEYREDSDPTNNKEPERGWTIIDDII
ncbi:MAG: hypothetical protein ISS01_01650 [Nanoarchaeota archaeon]|nr:hypothetical protein [Nanoarchaeota archaeon]